jgi:alpha-tubulin suppressor-like RCC1 family protein
VHVLALLKNGEVYGWGSNINCQISPDEELLIFTPRLILLSGKVLQVIAGSYSSAVLTTDGELVVWGENDTGGLGLGEEKTVNSPTTLFPEGVQAAALGWNHGLAIMKDSSVMIWGEGTKGQLGCSSFSKW